MLALYRSQVDGVFIHGDSLTYDANSSNLKIDGCLTIYLWIGEL